MKSASAAASARLTISALLLALNLPACHDQTLLAPAERSAPETLQQAVECRVHILKGTIACASPGATSAAGVRADLLLGWQNVYVRLTSSNVRDSAGTFTFDVTLENLIPQAMGTTNGVTPDSSGIKVFFVSPPVVTVGTGEVVVNGDGNGTFTNANQEFYLYAGALLGADGILRRDEVSGVRRWEFTHDAGVVQFAFLVFVSAPVRYPYGWIDILPVDPGEDEILGTAETMPLRAVIKSAVGNTLPGGVVLWSSSDEGKATVDSAGVVHGAAHGSVTITALMNLGGGRTRSGSMGLDVYAPPTLDSLTPGYGNPRDTVAVSLTGTYFAAGATVAVSGTGITVDNVVFDSTSMTASFIIDSLAQTGDHDVTVITPGGSSNPIPFNVNIPPVVVGDTAIADEGVTCLPITFSGSDTEGNYPLTFNTIMEPVNGEILLDPDSTTATTAKYCYRPFKRFFHGRDSLDYRATDSRGGVSSPQRIQICIENIGGETTHCDGFMSPNELARRATQSTRASRRAESSRIKREVIHDRR